MELDDLMHYVDVACRVAQLPRFEWTARRSSKPHRNILHRIILGLGALNLAYHNIGCVIYGYRIHQKSLSLKMYVAELSTAGAILGFTLLGTLNLCQLVFFGPQIEQMLEVFDELFPQTKQRTHNSFKYYEVFTRNMKKLVIFYALSSFYYNILPLVIMFREHFFTESQELSYEIQSSTWYPWKIHGSIIGFISAYVLQSFSSLINIGTIMTTQFLISFCGTQLEMHFNGLAMQLEVRRALDSVAKKQLKALLTYHNTLLNAAASVNRIFNLAFFASFLISTLCMCFMGLSMTVVDFAPALKHTIGLIIISLYNFSICGSGTNVALASGKVLPAAFYNNWYEGDLVYQKMLLMMMLRAAKPYGWRAYKLIPVSITTYMATLKFSYQMFTCVRSLK